MKLNAAFGAGYKIYQNDVEQGFKEPCFFIAVLKPDISPLQKNRFMNRNPFTISQPAGETTLNCSLWPGI